MRTNLFLSLILVFLLGIFCESAYSIDMTQLPDLQRLRNSSKLYAHSFVTRGSETTFKVFTKPNYLVKLIVDYNSHIEKTVYQQNANDNGVAVFIVKILDDENLVGKSVAIDAYVSSPDGEDVEKAIMQTEQGSISGTNRIYIADKDTEKGVMFSPVQAINQIRMHYDYSENSDFNPDMEQMYYDSTPVYVKNMRDAQDNVR